MKATMTVLTVGFIMQMLSLLLSMNSGIILKEEMISTASGSGIHTYYNIAEMCSENMWLLFLKLSRLGEFDCVHILRTEGSALF